MSDREIWKPVEGFPNTEISNLGRVRSLFRGGCKIRPTHANQNGYLIVALQNKSLRLKKRVHVLVAAAFIGPKPPRMDVNHIDGNKANNEAGNLEYVTRSENHRHAFRLGLAKSPFTGRVGEKHFAAKLTDRDVISMRELFANGVPRHDLAEKFGLSYYTVWDITTRRSWKHI